MLATLPAPTDRITANEVREALVNVSHTLRVLRAVGRDTAGVMDYADSLLEMGG